MTKSYIEQHLIITICPLPIGHPFAQNNDADVNFSNFFLFLFYFLIYNSSIKHIQPIFFHGTVWAIQHAI